MSEKFIKRERARQLVRQNLLQTLVYYRSADEKSKFEHEITKIIKRNKIKQRIEQRHAQYDLLIKERREALNKVLEEDNIRYKKEVDALIPTQEQQIEAMRQRVNQLRERKEKERQAFVAEKLMQQWRNNCDDLRDLTSKMMDKQVSAVRDNQLLELADRKAKEAVEKKHYEDLWEQDRLKKIAREEADKARQKRLHDEVAQMLIDQVKQLTIKRQEEAKLKEEEAQLNRQQLEMDRLQQERKAQIREHQQRVICAELDRFNRNKIMEKQKASREALEADLRMLAKLAELDQQEKEEISRKKLELRREVLAYRDYLLEQKRQAAEFEHQLNDLYLAEAERRWQMKAEKLAKEQMARDKLMKEVISTRELQIAEALERNRQKQEQVRQEKLTIEKAIAEYEADEHRKQMQLEHKMEDYERALQEQIKQVRIRNEDDRQKQLRLIEADREADRQYKTLLESEMNRIRNRPIIRGKTI